MAHFFACFGLEFVQQSDCRNERTDNADRCAPLIHTHTFITNIIPTSPKFVVTGQPLVPLFIRTRRDAIVIVIVY